MSLEPDEARASGGPLAAEISTTFVRLHKEHGGRGPTKCRTCVDDDLIIVLIRGGYSRFEDTLFEDGKWLDVRRTRHAFQDTMEGRFTEAIERVTGREVAAFMSASHQRPDLQIEAFVLDGPLNRRIPSKAVVSSRGPKRKAVRPSYGVGHPLA